MIFKVEENNKDLGRATEISIIDVKETSISMKKILINLNTRKAIIKEVEIEEEGEALNLKKINMHSLIMKEIISPALIIEGISVVEGEALAILAIQEEILLKTMIIRLRTITEDKRIMHNRHIPPEAANLLEGNPTIQA